jgi:dipeptidyl-peptidase-4
MPTAPAIDAEFLAAQAATYGFSLGTPKVIAIAPDGDVLFLRTPPRSFVGDLYQLDAASGKVEKLATADGLLAGKAEALSDAEKARRERTRTATRGIIDAELSKDGTTILVPLGERVFAVDRARGTSREVTVTGYPYDPHLSPDGTRLGWVHDGDLYVAPLAGGSPTRLTTRPALSHGDVEHAVAEFAAQEELDRRAGWWWSPDGSQIAYQRTDNSPVDTLWVGDPRHPEKQPVAFRYPRTGRPNAVVTLGVLPAGGGDTTWIEWDRARWPYLAHVEWTKNAPLTLVVLDREQYEIAVLAADPKTGKTSVLALERDEAWINLPPHATRGAPTSAPRWLPDGSGFLWMSEKSGAWQLELRGKDGAVVRTLTDGALGLRALVGIDAEAGVAWLSASADPTQEHLYTVPLAGGTPTQITTGEGLHAGSLSKESGAVVISAGNRRGEVSTSVRWRDGRSTTLPSEAEAPPYLPNATWETVAVDGRDHHAVIIRPRNFDPTKKYPVILRVYGGPHAQMVVADARKYLKDQIYADAGFVVVMSDNRGTPARGRAWERVIVKDLVTVAMDDQVAVLQALGKKHPELDLSRVGVHGWSFGGYMAAMAVLLRPDVFAAAVAGAPVTDWQLYDTAYTERYMKLPENNVAGYAHTSALTHAAKLDRPLLLIHGMTDDNVHFAQSLALMEALFAVGKRADLVTLSATHMVPDPKLTVAREQIQIDFFRQHLQP